MAWNLIRIEGNVAEVLEHYPIDAARLKRFHVPTDPLVNIAPINLETGPRKRRQVNYRDDQGFGVEAVQTAS